MDADLNCQKNLIRKPAHNESESVSVPVVTGLALASCPYAKRDGGDGHAHLDRRDYTLATSAAPAAGKAGVFFMNRIGPSSSELFVANAD
ncbi:hypothetical protein HDU82_007300, partial [Entophlyctis luteolus]